MPKRKSCGPTEFACPGCQEMFDAETHVPFVGSCGDSICAVCLNEKKIKNCPECKLEGAFACKQENKLAMKLLSAAAEKEATDSKKARLDVGEETNTSGEPVPAILDPMNLPFLAQIVNQLDPCSFVRFSRACKTFHRICFNSREIKVIFEIPKLHFTQGGQLQNEGQNAVLGSAEFRQKLRNYPFEFRVKHLDINEFEFLTSEYFHNIRTLLNEFPITTISKFSVVRISGWDGFLQLVKDFHIPDVLIWFSHFASFVLFLFHGGNNEEALYIPEEVATYLLQNTGRFESDADINDSNARSILNSSVQRLYLKKANISQETFVELIKRFAHSTEEVQWQLGQQQFDFGHYGIFKVHNPLHNEEDGPEERPVIAMDDNNPLSFWILRKDGSRVKCFYHNEHIVFSSEKFDYEPDPDYTPYESESEDDYEFEDDDD